MKVEININNYVKFRLTPHGEEIFDKWIKKNDYLYEVPPVHSNKDKSAFIKRLKGGWCEAQLWYVMNIFGEETTMGRDGCFKNSLFIFEEDGE